MFSAAFLDVFRQQAADTALVDLAAADGRTYTYGECLDIAGTIIGHLEARGVVPGDRVAVMLPNGAEFALFHLACLLGGFTVVPLNPQAPDATLEYMLDLVRPRLLVGPAEGVGRIHVACLRWVVVPGELTVAGKTGKLALADDNLLAVFFTSGTAAKPKGVCHRTGRMLANVTAFNRNTGLGRKTRMLHVMPMSYMAGFLNTLLSPLVAGGTVVIAPAFGPASSMNFWKDAMAGEANAVWLTPTMLAMLVQVTRDPLVPTWAASHFEHVFVGTAPLPPSIRNAFEAKFGVRCRESYGMTEVLLVAAQAPDQAPGTVGRPLEGIAIECRDEEGGSLSAGMPGELWIDTPFAFAGYLDPQTGAAPRSSAERWFPTGDVGLLDHDGGLFITDRKKDILIRGGANISPRAIEEILLRCDGVRDVAVIGLPHPFWGEEVAAVLELEPGRVLDLIRVDAAARVRSELGADATPSRWCEIKAFSRSSTGKIQKAGLKSLFF